MADEEQQEVVQQTKVIPIIHVTTPEDFKTRIQVHEKVTAVLFMSTDCPFSVKDAVPTFESMAVDPELEHGVVFVQVNVTQCPAVAHEARVFALPAFHFFSNGRVLESFSGNNSEKAKLMARNAIQRRLEVIAAEEAKSNSASPTAE